MSIPIITEGATTTHNEIPTGAIVTECESRFAIYGKGTHLEGMQHLCPKCGCKVSAIASNHTKTVFGKAVILEGDMTTCGLSLLLLKMWRLLAVAGLLGRLVIRMMKIWLHLMKK